jgi:hypothetical protein
MKSASAACAIRREVPIFTDRSCQFVQPLPGRRRSTPPPPPASARPDVLNLAGTTPFECTICTAVAPLAVFTVRT